jgi:hypothetical protein
MANTKANTGVLHCVQDDGRNLQRQRAERHGLKDPIGKGEWSSSGSFTAFRMTT